MPTYTLKMFSGGGCVGVTIKMSEPCPRAEALIRGINMEDTRFSWDLTPIRCEKWKLLYDAGWDWDGKWFRMTPGGFRWCMREAVHICEDMALKSVVDKVTAA